jgi:hypothetical protein
MTQFAYVALGGLTVGFAVVELDAGGNKVNLASPWLLNAPVAAPPEPRAAPDCSCRSEDLAFARLRSRCGAVWTLGVMVCAAHRCLRAA